MSLLTLQDSDGKTAVEGHLYHITSDIGAYERRWVLVAWDVRWRDEMKLQRYWGKVA